MALATTVILSSNRTTGSTSWTTGTLTAGASVGDVVVLAVASDNAGTNGARSLNTTSPTVNNAGAVNWRPVDMDLLNDPGNASAGCHLVMWVGTVTTALTTATTFTVSFSTSTTSVAAVCTKITAAAGFIATVNTTHQIVGTSTAPSVSTGTLASGNLVIGACAIENNAAITADSDTTNGTWSAATTALANTGTSGTSMQCTSQSKVVTGSGTQTYNLTITSTDWAAAAITFTEMSLSKGFQTMTRLAAVSRAASW